MVHYSLFITEALSKEGVKSAITTTVSAITAGQPQNAESIMNKRMHNEQNNAAYIMVRAGNGKQ